MGLFRKSKREMQRREPRLIDEPEPRRAREKKPRRRFRMLSWMLTLGMWSVIGFGVLTVYVWLSLAQKGVFNLPEREPGAMLLASDGELLAERGAFFGDDVRLDELPDYVPDAVIAVEDRRFRSHFGIDLQGLGRATLANIRAGRIVEGGSTITQQLAKNLFLDHSRTFERKLQEMVLALWLEAKYSKDEILQLYLNRVYYGAGATGIEKAALRYFGHSARELTIAEAASLAAVLKAPTNLNPLTRPAENAARAAEVIKDMRETQAITAAEAEMALNAPAEAKPRKDSPATLYIVDWVMEQLPDLIGKFDQSIVVETTIDRRLQALAQKSVSARIEKDGKKLGVSQAAAVMLNTKGEVVALVGGRNYTKSQFNRITKARRQPGSAFKPFVYLTAIEQGMTPYSTEIDEPVRIGKWEPENYKREYLGPVTLTQALSQSLNTVAAKLAVKTGPENVIATARRLGISADLSANASIALGTSEVTPLEMTSAFATFANGGSGVVPHIVKRITTRDGTLLYERRGSGIGEVMSSADAGAMNYMLREVISSGTGTRAAIPGVDIAGKTGTSQNYRDAWFIGYSSYYVLTVWAGNDDNSPTKRVTGGGLPAQIWKDVMAPAHQDLEWKPLPGEPIEDVLANAPRDGLFDMFQQLFRQVPLPPEPEGAPRNLMDWWNSLER
jgi:penicillin-binding protein 1A